MSSHSEPDSSLLNHSTKHKEVVNQTDNMDSNHDDSNPRAQDGHNTIERDDPATMAASEELKHTTISDRNASKLKSTDSKPEPATTEDNDMEEVARDSTPERKTKAAQDEEIKEKIYSPKKKRARDAYDESIRLEGDDADETGSSADGNAVNGSRSRREGPEKKRHRDTSEDPLTIAEQVEEIKNSTTSNPTDDLDTDSTKQPEVIPVPPPKATFGSGFIQPSQTSASAFASSGFGSLAASGISPFGAAGASKTSVFGGNVSSSPSSFDALGGSKSKVSTTTATITSSGFGGPSGDKPASGFGFANSSTSGFGGLGNSSVFGSALGKGFGGGSGPKLSNFAAPSKEASMGSKPVRAFGAPESDKEDGSDEESGEEGAESDEEREKNTSDERKKPKVSKVPVTIEDGESGEATLLQMRAKLFALESKEAGWKERGVGSLKINVPKSCAAFDENGLPIPGSFDPSGFDHEQEDESSVPSAPRLIMRQENTHRVVLNTIILRSMDFNDKPSSSAAQIMFTAIEGEKDPKPVNLLFKMSETNARLFRSEIKSIQREL